MKITIVGKDSNVVRKVDNTWLEDKELSWKAKGLLAYMFSCPDDSNFSVNELSKHSDAGKATVITGVKELEEKGYLEIKRTRKNGKFGESNWQLFETPSKRIKKGD